MTVDWGGARSRDDVPVYARMCTVNGGMGRGGGHANEILEPSHYFTAQA